MKKGIHPNYFDGANISCACGNKIEVGSTVEKMSVEVCGKCHPFYTGKHKLLDTTGRVERFNKKYEKFFAANQSPKKKKESKEEKKTEEKE